MCPASDVPPLMSNDGTPLVSVVDMGSPEYHGISVESDMSSIDTYGRQRVGKKGWGHLGNVTGLSIYIRYARSVTPRWNDSSCETVCRGCYARSATPRRWNDSSCARAHNPRPSDMDKTRSVTCVKNSTSATYGSCIGDRWGEREAGQWKEEVVQCHTLSIRRFVPYSQCGWRRSSEPT